MSMSVIHDMTANTLTYPCLPDVDSLDGRLLFAIPKKGETLNRTFCFIVLKFKQEDYTRNVSRYWLVHSWSPPKRFELIYRFPYKGADIQFRRHNRLDVCLSLNHHLALYVSLSFSFFHKQALLTRWQVFSFLHLISHPLSAKVTSISGLLDMMLF